MNKMNRQVLKQVMLENQVEVERYQVYPRNYFVVNDWNYVFIGVRRAGKSFLLYQRMQELLAKGVGWDEMLYVNFEDERLDGFTKDDFNLILEVHQELYGKRPILFLDEVQNVEGWEKFARRLADNKYRVCITGSNAKMLGKEIHTTLGARYLCLYVFPYSFCEYLSVHGIPFDEHAMVVTESRAAIIRMFNEYFTGGGYPEAALLASKRNYLTSAYQKIYLGDIAGRNGITNTMGLKVMFKKLAESVKQPISFNRIASIVSSVGGKLSVTTALKYMDYSKDACLIWPVQNIAAKLAERESNNKYYFIDNGLLNLLLFDGKTSLLENLVAINLIRRFGAEDAVFFYNKDIEVDFYLPMMEWAIQVSYDIKDEATYKREIGALEQIAKVLPCERRTVVVYDEERSIELKDGSVVEVVPVWKFLIRLEQMEIPVL